MQGPQFFKYLRKWTNPATQTRTKKWLSVVMEVEEGTERNLCSIAIFPIPIKLSAILSCKDDRLSKTTMLRNLKTKLSSACAAQLMSHHDCRKNTKRPICKKSPKLIAIRRRFLHRLDVKRIATSHICFLGQKGLEWICFSLKATWGAPCMWHIDRAAHASCKTRFNKTYKRFWAYFLQTNLETVPQSPEL